VQIYNYLLIIVVTTVCENGLPQADVATIFLRML